jgi:hypothetical protein
VKCKCKWEYKYRCKWKGKGKRTGIQVSELKLFIFWILQLFTLCLLTNSTFIWSASESISGRGRGRTRVGRRGRGRLASWFGIEWWDNLLLLLDISSLNSYCFCKTCTCWIHVTLVDLAQCDEMLNLCWIVVIFVLKYCQIYVEILSKLVLKCCQICAELLLNYCTKLWWNIFAEI